MLRRAWLFIRGIPGTIARSTWNALTWLASTPFTDSSGRQHRRTILGSVKSGISGVFGRGDPNRSKYDDFLSSARQRDMGNDVSLTYSRTGQLVMCLAGHVLTDGTLDKFKALQDGGEEGIDPQSAGLRRRGFFSFYSSAGYGHSGADESKVKKLRGFAKLLKDVGGSIDVETTGTGNRVLVFRLPPNCTPEDAENILNNFFRLLNIDNKEAAKSIAKDLTQRSEDEERGHVSHSPIPAPDTPSREGGAEVVTAAQVHTPPEGPFPPQPKEISPPIEGAEDDLAFSMSMPPGGGTPPPPLEGLDPVGAQERFLTSSGSGDTEQGRGEPGMDPESLMAASQGLEGVVHDGSLGQKQTALTPGSSTPGMSQSSRGV